MYRDFMYSFIFTRLYWTVDADAFVIMRAI